MPASASKTATLRIASAQCLFFTREYLVARLFASLCVCIGGQGSPVTFASAQTPVPISLIPSCIHLVNF
jgi:hypothetical protein